MLNKSIIEKMSLAELQALVAAKIEEQRKRLPTLLSRRERLQAELNAVNEEIALVEGGEAPARRAKAGRKKTGKRGPGRPRGSAKALKAEAPAKAPRRGAGRKAGGKRVTLPQALLKLLQGSSKPMSPNELCAAIAKSNHPSAKSPSLRLQVTTALSRRPEFTRVGHGLYEASK